MVEVLYNGRVYDTIPRSSTIANDDWLAIIYICTYMCNFTFTCSLLTFEHYLCVESIGNIHKRMFNIRIF